MDTMVSVTLSEIWSLSARLVIPLYTEATTDTKESPENSTKHSQKKALHELQNFPVRITGLHHRGISLGTLAREPLNRIHHDDVRSLHNTLNNTKGKQ